MCQNKTRLLRLYHVLTEKGLFTQLINFSKSNDYKFILCTEGCVVFVSENEEKAKCLKKTNEGWETKHFDIEKALKIFNLKYTSLEDDVETEETESDDGVAKINGILIILCVSKY